MNNERLNELLEKDYSILTTKEKSEITNFYTQIHNSKTCKSCKDKSESYYNKLKNDSLNKLELSREIDDSNFKLRTNLGVTKIVFDNSQYISIDECEDSVAIGFLKANPNRISMFEKYPENWKQLIENNEKENENE